MSLDKITVDVKFLDTNGLTFVIKQYNMEMNFTIACPNKYGVAKWQDLRYSKMGVIRYDGCKMNERAGYNITILYNENAGNFQYIKCIDGILEFGMIENHGKKEQCCNMSIKIPIETCYDALDKIIEKYKK